MNNFDERQDLIRGKIFTHMFIIMAVLLFLNAFLNSIDIIWADGFHSSILILMAATMIGSIEMIVRDVYFRNKRESLMAWFFVGIGIFLFILSVRHMIGGESIISGGTITDEGFSFILSVIFLSIGAIGAIKFLIDRKRERKGEES